MEELSPLGRKKKWKHHTTAWPDLHSPIFMVFTSHTNHFGGAEYLTLKERKSPGILPWDRRGTAPEKVKWPETQGARSGKVTWSKTHSEWMVALEPKLGIPDQLYCVRWFLSYIMCSFQLWVWFLTQQSYWLNEVVSLQMYRFVPRSSFFSKLFRSLSYASKF